MIVMRTNIIPLTKPEDLLLAIRELEARINALNINIAESGTGGGILEILGGDADIVMTDVPVLDGGSA